MYQVDSLSVTIRFLLLLLFCLFVVVVFFWGGGGEGRSFGGFCSHTLSHGLCIKLIHSVLQSVQGENIATSFGDFVATLCLTGCVLS